MQKSEELGLIASQNNPAQRKFEELGRAVCLNRQDVRTDTLKFEESILDVFFNENRFPDEESRQRR